jgi:hypothetical protein
MYVLSRENDPLFRLTAHGQHFFHMHLLKTAAAKTHLDGIDHQFSFQSTQ